MAGGSSGLRCDSHRETRKLHWQLPGRLRRWHPQAFSARAAPASRRYAATTRHHSPSRNWSSSRRTAEYTRHHRICRRRVKRPPPCRSPSGNSWRSRRTALRSSHHRICRTRPSLAWSRRSSLRQDFLRSQSEWQPRSPTPSQAVPQSEMKSRFSSHFLHIDRRRVRAALRFGGTACGTGIGPAGGPYTRTVGATTNAASGPASRATFIQTMPASAATMIPKE